MKVIILRISGFRSRRSTHGPILNQATRNKARKGAIRHASHSSLAVGDSTPSRVSDGASRSEEHTSELQSLMRTSYAVFCLKKKIIDKTYTITMKYTLKHDETHSTSNI